MIGSAKSQSSKIKDVDRVQANVMYAVQQPLHVSTLEEVMGTPAWKTLPTWYLVASNDGT